MNAATVPAGRTGSITRVPNAETDIQQRIRLALGTRSDLRLFRNNTGTLPDPRTGRPVQFGLARGSADLIGWRTITITPEMVGQRVAIFTSIEVKTTSGRTTPAQQAWLGTVRGAGGIAGVARSVSDAVRIMDGSS
jgi:hypothetical protein